MEKHAESGTGGIPRRAFNDPRALASLGSSNLSPSFGLDIGRSVASPTARSIMRTAGGDPTVLTRIAADKAEIIRTERITRRLVADALAPRNAGNLQENQRQLDQARRNVAVIADRVQVVNERILGQIAYLQGRAVNDSSVAKASIGLANKLTREYNGNTARLRKLQNDTP